MKNLDWRFMAAQTSLLLCLVSITSFGQIARIEPAQPKSSQKVTVVFDTKARGAMFTTNDELYVSVESSYPYEDIRVKKMMKEGDLFKADFDIKPEWARISFSFRTVSTAIFGSRISSMIYGDDGRPVRGAYIGEMVEGNQGEGSDLKKTLELFDKEIANYPNNYAAFPAKWRVAGRSLKSEEWKAMVNSDLDSLLKKNDEAALELSFAVASAYVMIKQPDKALPALKKMVSSRPESLLTENVITNLWYQFIAGDLSVKGREDARTIEYDYIRRNPDKRFCRENLWQFWAEEDGKLTYGDLPLESVEAITNNWVNEEPENPRPTLALAAIYSARKQKMDLVFPLLEKSIGLLLRNKSKVFRGYDTTDDELIQAYELKARSLFQQGAFERAYECVKTAQAVEANSRYKTTDHKLYDLEGRIWRSLDALYHAEKAYLIAWKPVRTKPKGRSRRSIKRKWAGWTAFAKY